MIYRTLLAAALIWSGAASAATSVLDLQQFQIATDAAMADGTPVRLIDLNPTVGRWYLLSVGDPVRQQVHLETPDGVTLALDPWTGTLTASNGSQTRDCAIDGPDGPLARQSAGSAYVSACGGSVWVRQPTHGSRSMLEAATEVLRSTGTPGEELINFYKNTFSDTAEAASYGVGNGTARAAFSGPPPAVLAAGWAGRTVAPGQLGIPVDGAPAGGMELGTWYPAHGLRGVYASELTAEAAGTESEPGQANTAFFVAWDMDRYALRYTVGATHPALGWSNRAPPPHIGPGPDGFDDAAPLARIGMVPPYDRNLLVGSFAGGFKREHGAFKYGRHIGVHYGFAEDGVVLSKLQPGLMTVFAGLDGVPHMRTFSPEDANKGAAGLMLARQTGYALVENGAEGEHVGDAAGNWSGSNDGHLLTMRSAACVLPVNGKTYLVYGVFTSATPKDLAVTLRAFGCRDAALLDMNNPVLVYSAVYRQDEGRLQAELLMRSMGNDRRLRFVDQPDSRDFFYLLKRAPD